MDFSFTPEDEAFRAELRDWLDRNLPDFRENEEELTADGGELALSKTMSRRKAWQRAPALQR